MRITAALFAFLLPGVALAEIPPQVLYSQPGKWAVPQTFNQGTITPSQRYDATAFGACVWDGAHDVAPCVQAASTAAFVTGAEVDLPCGTLPMASSLTNTAGAFVLRGRGACTVLKVMVGNVSSPYLLNFANVSNITVSDLVLDGGGQSIAQVNPATQLFNTSNVTFDRVTWQNISGIGLNGSGANNTIITNSRFIHVGNRWKTTLVQNDRYQAVSLCCGTSTLGLNNKITGSYFEDIGLDAISSGSQTGLVVANNIFNMANNQIALLSSATYGGAIFPLNSVNATITGNIITGAQGNAIDAPGIRSSTISGNIVSGSGGSGIALFQGYDLVTFTGAIAGTTLTVSSVASGTITAGMIVGTQLGAATAIAPQTYITAPIDATHWTVSVSQTVGSEALYAGTNAQSVSVAGNTVTNNNQWGPAPWTGGITIGEGLPDRITISGNTVTDTQITKTQVYGVAVQTAVASPVWTAAPTNLLISTDNNLTGNLTAEISGAPVFSVSGCGATSPVGSASAGYFNSGTTGTCTVTVFMGGPRSAYPLPPNGWNCLGVDQNTGALLVQTNGTTGTVTLAGPTTSGDFVRLSCVQF